MNAGAIAFLEGILFVGENFGRGRVLVFDEDGRGLHAGFELGPGSAVSGLVADSDRRLWIADTASRHVRLWNVFGREDAGFVPQGGVLEAAAGGRTDGPVDVALAAGSTYTGVWALEGGLRRSAVGLYLPDGTRLEGLRSEGNPKQAFDHGTRLATAGELVAVLEHGRRQVQVFRGLEFHFAIPLMRAAGVSADRAVALALLTDGSALVGLGPSEDAEVDPGAGVVERILWLEPSGHVRAEIANSASPQHPGGSTIDGLVDFALDPGSDPTAHSARDASQAALYVLDRLGKRVQVFNLEGRAWGAFDTEEPFVVD